GYGVRTASAAKLATCNPAHFLERCRCSPAPSDQQRFTQSGMQCFTRLQSSISQVCSNLIPDSQRSCREPLRSGSCATRPPQLSFPLKSVPNNSKTWLSI